MAVDIHHSDFGAQGKKIYHYFHFFPLLFAMKDGPGCHDLSCLKVDYKFLVSTK